MLISTDINILLEIKKNIKECRRLASIIEKKDIGLDTSLIRLNQYINSTINDNYKESMKTIYEIFNDPDLKVIFEGEGQEK